MPVAELLQLASEPLEHGHFLLELSLLAGHCRKLRRGLLGDLLDFVRTVLIFCSFGLLGERRERVQLGPQPIEHSLLFFQLAEVGLGILHRAVLAGLRRDLSHRGDVGELLPDEEGRVVCADIVVRRFGHRKGDLRRGRRPGRRRVLRRRRPRLELGELVTELVQGGPFRMELGQGVRIASESVVQAPELSLQRLEQCILLIQVGQHRGLCVDLLGRRRRWGGVGRRSGVELAVDPFLGLPQHRQLLLQCLEIILPRHELRQLLLLAAGSGPLIHRCAKLRSQ